MLFFLIIGFYAFMIVFGDEEDLHFTSRRGKNF